MFRDYKMYQIQYMGESKIKRVSFVGWKDYANVMTEYSDSINKYVDGFESKVICEVPHPINYGKPHDFNLQNHDVSGNVIRNEEVIKESRSWLRKSNHIIFAPERGPNWGDGSPTNQQEHINKLRSIGLGDPKSHLTGLGYVSNILGMDIIKDTLAGNSGNVHLYHTGSHYRNNSELYNIIGINHFNKLIHSVDLYRLSWYDLLNMDINNTPLNRLLGINKKYSEENHVTLYTSYDKDLDKVGVNEIIDGKFVGSKILIFHAPTSREMKGTDIITQVVNDVIKKLDGVVDVEFITPQTYYETKNLCDKDTGWIDNVEIMKLKKRCHIYIDEFNPQVGYFGGSTVEALMTGNVTFATINNFTPEAIISANKNINASVCPVINIGPTPDEFNNILMTYLQKPMSELKEIAKTGLDWYYQTSTHKSVAVKFEKEILI